MPLFHLHLRRELNDNGDVDYTSESHRQIHQSVLTVDLADLMRDAQLALNDPTDANEFIAKSLNLFHQLNESPTSTSTTLPHPTSPTTGPELAKLPINWYEVADLSASRLNGWCFSWELSSVDIVMRTPSFPLAAALKS